MAFCQKTWAQLHGVPLLPLANGQAGTFRTSRSFSGRDRYILASRRQQSIIPKLNSRFIHPKAVLRLKAFFERDEFLEVGGCVSKCIN